MKTRTRLIAFAAVALGLAAGGLLGGTLAERGTNGRAAAPASAAAAGAVADRALAGLSAGGASDVASLETAVRARPEDVHSLTLLGYAYQQRWRETADASFLPRPERRCAERVRSHRATRWWSSASARWR